MEITINLNESLYAHGFDNNNKIHASDLERVKDIIRKQVDEIEKISEGQFILNHNYRTIGIFGDRGSGKTSFIISLLEECSREFNDIQVLNIIDPTLVEHKKPIILCVISMINQLIEKYLHKNEFSRSTSIYQIKMEWENIIKDISVGIFAIDEVGKGYEDTLWQDEDFVMNTGLNKVNKANEFEKNLRTMFNTALKILGKKAFILTFDDIDVNIKQGWNVLETLRRYLSDNRIISIVSGNIKLYGMLIRKELCKDLVINDYKSRRIMENELQSQYMLKILNPSNRINLLSISDIIQSNTIKIIKNRNEQSIELKDAYQTILTKLNITDTPSQKIFTNFFLSMSLRSQIHFLKDAYDNNGYNIPLDIFAARLYAANIDIKTLEMNAQHANIIILDYLLNTNNLADCYLLLPTQTDKDINSNFTALTFIASKHFKTFPHATFDYMLRIGFLRNLILPLEDSKKNLSLCKYAGWNHIISLKNSIGLTMAYMERNTGNCQKIHIPIFGMKKTAKKTTEYALDKALKDEEVSDIIKLLAMFPFIQILNTNNNESSNYYSIFSLIGIISEIIKCEDPSEMTACINDLKQFRSYIKPQDENYYSDESEIEQDSFGIEISTDSINNLAQEMHTWKNNYLNVNTPPPYVIGRIMTRLYSSVINIKTGFVGKDMNLIVSSFFNSCLIEEARVKFPNKEQSKINNNNPRTNTDVFINNLRKLDIDTLNFSQWIMSCPMLNCFLDNETKAVLETYSNVYFPFSTENHNLYDVLNKLRCKINQTRFSHKNQKSTFYGSRDKINQTLKIFASNNIDENQIIDNILNQNINKAFKYIQSTKLFETIHKRSVEAFIINYHNLNK